MTTHPELQSPITFAPVYKDAIWGGTQIASALGRATDHARIAESWEVSDRDDGMSIVDRGPLAGQTLQDLIARFGAGLLGRASKDHARFPLLIKILDARDRLSIQVHPDDVTSTQYGGEAKSEMWYCLGADDEALLYHGMQEGTDASRVRQAIADADMDTLMRTVQLSRGDAIYVPGGLVHAIGSGYLLLEVQQNSNTTYRVYDWGRVGDDGQSRELHIDQALEVTHWDAPPAPVRAPGEPAAHRDIMETPYFKIDERRLSAPTELTHSGESFQVLFVAAGEVELSTAAGRERYPMATSILIPACLRNYSLRPVGDGATLVQIEAR